MHVGLKHSVSRTTVRSAEEKLIPQLGFRLCLHLRIDNEASLKKCFVFIESRIWNICVEIWIR